MKKIFLIFLSFAIFINSTFFALASCKYQDKIDECWEANKTGNPKAITDFLCSTGLNKEEIAYNLILDDKWKKIDKQSNEMLKSLQENKDLYFGPNKQKSSLEGVDDIYTMWEDGGYFEQKYQAVLAEVRAETASCFGRVGVAKVDEYFLNSSQVSKLIKIKNSVRRKIASDFMILNKQQIRKDIKKKFMQQRRTKYDEVANLFMINLGYIFRLSFKWVNKTKHPYKG